MTDLRLPLVFIALSLPVFVIEPVDAAMVLPDVGTVDYVPETRTVTLAIPTGARKTYQVSWVARSRRLDVEVEGMALPGKRTLFMNRGVVATLRAEPVNANRTRLIFELNAPADLRTITHGPANTLSLAIYAAGAPKQAVVKNILPSPSPSPSPSPTPAPRIALRTPLPAPRITPEPVLDAPVPLTLTPPSVEPTPALDVPALAAPVPQDAETPREEDSVAVAAQGPQVFGTRIAGGAELPLSVQETFDAENANIETGLTSAGAISYQHMFSPYLGMSLEGRGMRYAFRDQSLDGSGFDVTRSRLDLEGNLSVQGRLPVGSGFELMGRLGPAARAMNVTTTVRPEPAAEGEGEGAQAAVPRDITVSDYLSTPWQAYGVHTTLGAGYQITPAVSVSLTGGLNYLLAGSMGQANVPGIFPMLGLRGAFETRFDLGMVGMSLGYAWNNYRYGDGDARALSQIWHGPMLKLGISY